MRRDPSEMNNVYNDPAYAKVRAELHEQLKNLQKEVGDNDPDEKEYEFFSGAANL